MREFCVIDKNTGDRVSATYIERRNAYSVLWYLVAQNPGLELEVMEVVVNSNTGEVEVL